jgi:hypothetical protein
MNRCDRERLIDEEKRLRRLRLLVDLALAELMQGAINVSEAYSIMERTRKAALKLFPDKGSVYDLIYAPRFNRIMAERFPVQVVRSGKN